jgi:threonine dehydratase
VLLIRLIEHGLAAAGRYLRVRVQLDDRPGSLAALTTAVAALGLNVLGVEHNRGGAGLRPNEVQVLLSLETRGPAHRQEVLPGLARAGFIAAALDDAEPSPSREVAQ